MHVDKSHDSAGPQVRSRRFGRWARLTAAALVPAMVLAVAPSRRALGWGDEGHEMVMRIAIDLMPPGDRASLLASRNLEVLRKNLMQPDLRAQAERERGVRREGPNHYVNIEQLVPAGSDFEDFLRASQGDSPESGRVVSRILECAQKLREHASPTTRRHWLRWAAYLAHYVADAHQPLHTTTNFDGRQSGNLVDLTPGEDHDNVHHRFESGLVNAYKTRIESKARDLATAYTGTRGGMGPEVENFAKDPRAYVAGFIWGTHGHLDRVVQADKKLMRTRKQALRDVRNGKYYRRYYEAAGELAAEQIARAAIALAAIWQASASADPLQTSQVNAPESEFSTAFHKDQGIMPW